jgi:hypothetical protein
MAVLFKAIEPCLPQLLWPEPSTHEKELAAVERVINLVKGSE